QPRFKLSIFTFDEIFLLNEAFRGGHLRNRNADVEARSTGPTPSTSISMGRLSWTVTLRGIAKTAASRGPEKSQGIDCRSPGISTRTGSQVALSIVYLARIVSLFLP